MSDHAQDDTQTILIRELRQDYKELEARVRMSENNLSQTKVYFENIEKMMSSLTNTVEDAVIQTKADIKEQGRELEKLKINSSENGGKLWGITSVISMIGAILALAIAWFKK